MPSEKILAEKVRLTEELAEKIKNATAGVLVSYTGITVDQDTAMRAELRKAGVEYKVYKNTMTGRACDIAGYPEMKQYLEGMTALALSPEDPVAAAKVLKNYADKVETFEIKAGFIDNGVIDAAGVMELANIPSKEGLICKVLGSIQSPLYKLAYALQAIIDKNGEGAPAEEAAAEAPAEEAAPAAEEAPAAE
ncbi:MAG: 50S ribosomal protein L10 [Clostridia bacterium]|nr:50S ribosomal protein L10 [Clostridia bacterium]